MIQTAHDKDMRTCKVSANTFEGTFNAIASQSGADTWVAQSTPSGPCGAVQLSRFESESAAGVRFWKFFSRKAITNPTGMFYGQSCSGFDQREYEWDWRSEETFQGCDYIEFSPI